MIVFCHIPKTAGMAVKHVLKSNLGLRFLSSTTWGKARAATTASDLRYELLLSPRPAAIGGHGMRPFIDYGELGKAFRWITILRDPVARLISHYVYDLENGRAGDSFEAWLQGDIANYQVRWIAGEPDLELAKSLLDTKFVFVGFQEQFRESLVLMNHVAFDDRLRIQSERRVNATRSTDIKARVEQDVREHSELVDLACGLDRQLYALAQAKFWEPQVAALGSEVLAERLRAAFDSSDADHGKTRRMIHELHRNVIYKPALWCAKAFGVRV
ncbi:MAG: sulfotransferase family 2 domain-containing protein [Planctomycetota bacterium]|nr:sulfotransferase family 2 domain-containing protein [Planctomycetota bacterium]